MSCRVLLRSIGICAAALLAFRAAPAAAQTAGARMTASVTVVERVGFAAGPSTVAEARGGHLDVTTPLALQGRAATVVHVVEGDAIGGARRTPAAPRPTTALDAERGYTARLRLPPAPRDAAGSAKAALTYVVATVN